MTYRSERHFGLGNPAEAAANDALEVRRVFAACNDGPCRKGTLLCPTPEARQITEARAEEEDDGERPWSSLRPLYWLTVGSGTLVAGSAILLIRACS